MIGCFRINIQLTVVDLSSGQSYMKNYLLFSNSYADLTMLSYDLKLKSNMLIN